MSTETPPPTDALSDDTAACERAAVETVVTAVTRVWSSLRLYPESHPAIQEQLEAGRASLEVVLAGRDEVAVKHVQGHLVWGSQRLFARKPTPSGFVGAMARRHIDCITFTRGVRDNEILSLARALAAEAAADDPAASVRSQLEADGVRRVRVDQLAISDRVTGVGGLPSGMALAELYGSAIDIVRQTMHSVRVARPIDVESADSLTDEMVASITRDPSAAVGLACLKGHDEYTFAHCVHAALLSLSFGEAIGLDESELRELGIAAILHDVGKVLVPLEILRKPGRLTDDEWEAMGRHPSDGAAILMDYPELPAIAPVVAFEHHMGFDLGGYPKVRARRDLSLLSLIVTLSDIYDALTTHRPYRPPLRPDEALAEMLQMKERQLEPRLVEWFREMLGPWPPGTCVQLNTGESGVVCRSNPSMGDRPDVCVAVDADGAHLAVPMEISLAEPAVGGGYARSIVGAINPGDRGLDPSCIIDQWLNARYGALVEAQPAEATDG